MHDAHALTGQLDLLGFLVLGLLGSAAHCAVMCAPFVLMVSDRYASAQSGRPVMAAQLWYAAGRTCTYAALGAAAGGVGVLFHLAGEWAGVGRAAAAVAGAALVVSAAMRFVNARPLASSGLARVTRALYRRVPGHPFQLGLILGLLPCGLLYTAVVAAVARGSATGGALALTVFAVGTSPSLFAIAAAQQRLNRHAAGMVPIANAFVLVMGLWYLWRGLGA